MKKIFSQERRDKISNALKGKPKSLEHRRKLSEARTLKPNKYWLGKKRSPEDIEKFRRSHLGIKQSSESKLKKSLAISGEKNYQWGKGKRDGRTWRKYAPRPCPDLCESCGINKSQLSKGLFVDHNHKKNEFRGWLCTRCNVALGMVGDSVDKLVALINYLERSNL